MARFSHSTCSEILTASKLGKLSMCVVTQTNHTCTKSYRASISKSEWRSNILKSLKKSGEKKESKREQIQTRSKRVGTNTYALIIVLSSLRTDKRDGQNNTQCYAGSKESASRVGTRLGEKQWDEDLSSKH